MGRISEDIARYLVEERKLDLRLCEDLGISSRVIHRRGKPEPETAWCFDYRKGGKVHNTKLRFGKGDMPWAQKDKPLIFWGLEDVEGLRGPVDDPLVIVEGEPDRVSCIMAKFRFVLSVPNGAQEKATQADDSGKGYAYLYQQKDKLWPWLESFNKIILAVDGDRPGRVLRNDLAVRLGDTRCRWVSWPKGCKDANDVLRRHDSNTLRNVLLDARPMWNDEVCRLSDIEEEDDVNGLTTGIPKLDGSLRIIRPAFMVIQGPYSSGKSVFLRQLLWSLYRTHGWRFLLTAFEERIKPRYRRHFRLLELGKVEKDWTEEDPHLADGEIERACVFLRRMKGEMLTVERLLDRIEYAVKVYGLQVVAIDPVNEIDHNIGRNESQYWAEFIIACKRLQEDYGLLFIVNAHPSKQGLMDISPTTPLTLSATHGTMHFGNKADYGLCIWRPKKNGSTVMNIDKLKDHDAMGYPTMVELIMNSALNRFDIGRIGDNILEKMYGTDTERREIENEIKDEKKRAKNYSSKNRGWAEKEDDQDDQMSGSVS